MGKKKRSASGRSFVNDEWVRPFLPQDERLLENCCAQVEKALTPLLEDTTRGRMKLGGASFGNLRVTTANKPLSTSHVNGESNTLVTPLSAPPKFTRRQRRLSGQGLEGFNLLAFQKQQQLQQERTNES